MNLCTFEAMRHSIEDSYRNFLLQEWELDLRARAVLSIVTRTIRVECHRVLDGRVPLGTPLTYTFAEATAFGPAEFARMIDHVRLSINMNKLL
jgi:hypothetical protein